MSPTVLRLKPGQDRRLRAGHLWIYSNEIDTDRTPLRGLEPGAPVRVENARGRFLGHGYVNPHSLICVRLTGRDPEHPLDRSLLVHRMQVARSLRDRLFGAPFHRVVFGESDLLPGLVVDRHGSHLVAQIGTAGMERLRDEIVDALRRVFEPRSILWRNDSGVRELEGLERYVEPAWGRVPAQVEIEEGGCRFAVSPDQGQKTGWFYDQAANRDRLMPRVDGLRVLDVCSYVGAWGVRAACAGAREVLCVDASARALDGVRENARINGVAGRVGVLRGDAFDVLRALRSEGERFDVVVLDPPAFIKRRKDLKAGMQAYRRLNEAAMGLVSRDGMLVTASCSFHMDRDGFLRVVQRAARHGDRFVQLLERGQQAPDHPVHPAIPETEYLKALFLRVLPAG